MPNRENLKKRAKALVKQHRDGYFPVATRLRRGLQRFADWPDKAILSAPFALADALEVVAREEGFSSWARVPRRSNDMPRQQRTRPKDTPRLFGAYPQALVTDVTRAAEFYRDKLGFEVVYLYGSGRSTGWSNATGRASTFAMSTRPRAIGPMATRTC